MFPGGGAQYAGMARGPVRAPSRSSAAGSTGASLLCAASSDFDPKRSLFPSAAGASEDATARAEELLRRPGVQLPLLFIVEYALAQLLDVLGRDSPRR